MIAYKWVIKKNNKYFPLVNFGINEWMRNIQAEPYEIGKTYKYKGQYSHYNKNDRERDGYHFWLRPKKEFILNNWNTFLKRKNSPEINAILKCEIDEIKTYKDCWQEPRIIADKFTVLEEVKI